MLRVWQSWGGGTLTANFSCVNNAFPSPVKRSAFALGLTARVGLIQPFNQSFRPNFCSGAARDGFLPTSCWSAERFLVAATVQYLRAAAHFDSIVLEEFRTSFGLPDILHVRYDAAKLATRLGGNPPPRVPIGRDSAKVMSLVSREDLDAGECARTLGFVPRRFRAALAALVQRNLLVECDGRLRVREKSSCLITSIMVYEAKLKDWRKAIAQAQRHLWFADESTVLLPALSERVRDRVMTCCGIAGVGLATLTPAGLEAIHKPCPLPAAPNWLRWYLSETVFDIKSLEADAF